MWKDFFYFSKSQRIGIITLLILILLVGLTFFFISVYKVESPTPNSAFLAKARAFEKSLVLQDSLKRVKWENQYKSNETNQFQQPSYPLFSFDPNTLDSIGFAKLGIRNFIVHNILKFRNKGGKFKNAESFSKVYGLSKEKFDELEPYIKITETTVIRKDTLKSKPNTKYENIIVELNSADTTELMKIRGIGRSYAKAIVRFRQLTGGFVSIDQLKEIYGMTEANFSKISASSTINQQLVKKININTASVEKLNAHIYLDFYESKAIYEYRRRKGKVKSAQELLNISELKPGTFQKISPYLSFE